MQGGRWSILRFVKLHFKSFDFQNKICYTMGRGKGLKWPFQLNFAYAINSMNYYNITFLTVTQHIQYESKNVDLQFFHRKFQLFCFSSINLLRFNVKPLTCPFVTFFSYLIHYFHFLFITRHVPMHTRIQHASSL